MDIVKLHSSFIPQNMLFYQLPQMSSPVENMNDIQILYDGAIGGDTIDHCFCVHYSCNVLIGE